ncbi:diguanylate cyclase domain-containing protein [Escherichia coli]
MQELIDHAINHADNNKVGVVYLDLDNFKKVNDAYGHLFGDQLLRDVSLAILSCLEHDQVLARPGGDEFLVLDRIPHKARWKQWHHEILIRSRLPFRIGLIEVYTSCSVGIALSPNMVRTARLLFVTPTQQCTQRRKADEDNFAFLLQK